MNLCFKARLSAKSYANKTYIFHKKGSHLGCVPLGNLNLDFKIRISDLQLNAKSKKRDFNVKISVFGFPFYRLIGKTENGFEKLSLRTAVLYAHT